MSREEEVPDSGKAKEVNSGNHQVSSLKTSSPAPRERNCERMRTEVRVSKSKLSLPINSSFWSDSLSREEEVPDSGKAEEVNSRNHPVSSLNSSPAPRERNCEQEAN